jgi:hypothetical protein
MASVPASARYGRPLTSASDRQYTRPPRMVAGFIAVILNPLVVALQRW